MAETCLLLGREHTARHEYALEPLGAGRSAAVLSVGGTPHPRGLGAKGSEAQPNEDAVLVWEDGPRTLLAVADAHHGIAASHDLLAAMAEAPPPASLDPRRVAAWVADIHRALPRVHDRSRTALVVALVDRSRRRGVAIGSGDCLLARVDAEARPTALHEGDGAYLAREGRLDAGALHARGFRAPPGALLVAHSDGVHECAYGDPGRSLRPRDVAVIVAEADLDPVAAGHALARAALQGVRGGPGGEDNIAIALTRC